MRIQDDVLIKAFKEATIEQIEKDYVQQGYSVEREAKIGRLRADLVAQKDDKVTVFEFKAGRWNAEKTKAVTKLRNYVAHNLAGEFKLVLVNLPREREIFIEGIEVILHQILHEDTSQVDNLATHVFLDEIYDVDISSVDIHTERIYVIGSGSVSYELQYGSDSDIRHGDGVRSTEAFPFTFRLYLNHILDVDEVEEIDIVTSSFYE